jgi:hypothetical protein
MNDQAILAFLQAQFRCSESIAIDSLLFSYAIALRKLIATETERKAMKDRLLTVIRANREIFCYVPNRAGIVHFLPRCTTHEIEEIRRNAKEQTERLAFKAWQAMGKPLIAE